MEAAIASGVTPAGEGDLKMARLQVQIARQGIKGFPQVTESHTETDITNPDSELDCRFNLAYAFTEINSRFLIMAADGCHFFRKSLTMGWSILYSKKTSIAKI